MPILFRMKAGMGEHYIRRHGQMVCLRSGDQIRCEPHELGSAIRKFDQLEPDPPPPQPKVGLKAVHRGFGKWDVINQATGAKINDQPLSKQEAKELESSLSEPELPSAKDQIEVITGGKQPDIEQIKEPADSKKQTEAPGGK